MIELFMDAGQYNVTGFSSYLNYTNYLADYLLGSILLIAIFFLMIIITIGKTEKQSSPFVVSGFVTAFIAILFKSIGIINDNWLIGSIILSVVFYAWSYFEK